MTTPTQLIQIVKRLSVSPAGHAALGRLMADAGLKESTLRSAWHKEWLNDVVALYGTQSYEEAASDPDEHMLSWATDKLADPYLISYRIASAARAEFGYEHTMQFWRIRWRQEVAWATRQRGDSSSDRICALAETFLKAAQKQPARVFRGLLQVYCEIGQMDPSYIGATAIHRLSAEEILALPDEKLVWRPLWLRYADANFGPSLNNLPPAKVAAIASRIRAEETQERIARSWHAAAERLRAERPSFRFLVLLRAVALGLNSDELLGAECELIQRVADGKLRRAEEAVAAWQRLTGSLPAWLGKVGQVEPAEAERRQQAIGSLLPGWQKVLPPDIQQLGASKQLNVMDWFDDIRRSRRQAPADPVLDYALWLVERNSDKAAA